MFHSTNTGASWNAVNTGLKDTLVSALAICGKNIFAGNLPQTEPTIYRGALLPSGIWRNLL